MSFPALRTLACTLLTLSLAGQSHASSSTAIEISPTHITVGKSAELTLKLGSPKKIEDISLMPGGPYEAWSMAKAGDTGGPFQWQKHGDDIWIISMDRPTVAAAIFTPASSTSDTAQGHRFSAEGENGVRIYDEQGNRISAYQTTGPALDVSVANGIAYITNGANGLTLLDISEPQQPRWLSSHQKLGRVTHVHAEGTMVTAVNEDGVVFLIDASNRLEPTVISAYRSREAIMDAVLYADWVIARTESGVKIIDFTTETPQISNEGLDFGQGVNFGGERRVYIDNDLAYVADWFSGIHIYDISRPQMPVLLSSFHTPGSPKGMIVRDGVAFVPDDDHGLQIIDVSNPRDPQLISHIQTAGLGYTPKIVGDLLYLASHRGGFQIIDISDVSQPTLVSEFDTDGKAWSLEVKGDTLFVADDEPGLLMFDVSDPRQPTPIGQFMPGGTAEEVVIRDNIAFVAFFDNGLFILDIADPTQPKVISHTQLPGNTRGLDLVGDKLYVASWLAGVHILDISDLSHPQVLGQYDTRGAAWGLKAEGEQLFVMDWWGGISVLDISHARKPRHVGGYHERGRVSAIAAQENYIFVAQGSNGVQVFDINNPLHPTWTTGVEFPGQARDITLRDSHAYVAAGDGGIALLDISNPFNLHWLGNLPTAGDALAIQQQGQRLFVLEGDKGVQIYDLANAIRPPLIQQIHQPASDMALDPQHLYLATRTGIHVYVLDGSLFRLSVVLDGIGHPQQLYLWQGQLIVAVDDTLISFSVDQHRLEETSRIALDGAVRDITAANGQLYANTDHEVVALRSDNNGTLRLSAHYPLIGEARRLSSHRETLYVGGEKTVIALNPLPALNVTKGRGGEYTLSIPNNLGVGSYNIGVSYEDGTREIVKQAFSIDMFKFSKPKLSMEDFNKLMEEKRETDLFIQPNQ